MSQTIRFPYNRDIPTAGSSESNQIITILPSKTVSLAQGGEQNYVSIAAWKSAGESTESPYNCVVLEFSANIAGTIGNGTTELIGLYGQINLTSNPTLAAQRKRTLLGLVGFNLGATNPQIRIVQQAAAANDFVGISQVFTNIAAYDQLSIGGVLGTVTIPENLELTVVARPLRIKDFIG